MRPFRSAAEAKLPSGQAAPKAAAPAMPPSRVRRDKIRAALRCFSFISGSREGKQDGQLIDTDVANGLDSTATTAVPAEFAGLIGRGTVHWQCRMQ